MEIVGSAVVMRTVSSAARNIARQSAVTRAIVFPLLRNGVVGDFSMMDSSNVGAISSVFRLLLFAIFVERRCD
jgi:hypothetical protein